jgi:hypothetical protein
VPLTQHPALASHRRAGVNLDIISALDDPNLFQPFFAGDSWATWRVVLKAAFHIPMHRGERALFRGVADRDPPTQRVRELWAIVGRRGGKDSIASLIAAHAAIFCDHTPYLRAGERAAVLCIGCDRPQARIVLNYIRAYFAHVPMFAALVERETAEGLELNGVEIIVGTNSFRTVRGRSIACVVLDECAFYRSDESVNPDTEVYAALLPGLATIPDALLIGISSPYRRSGLLYDRWRESYGKDDQDILVVKGPSRTFNPTLPQRIVDQALERDPEAAAAEYLAEWRSDLQDWIDRTVIDRAVVPGRVELPPAPRQSYFGFCDPSGGSSDSMTLAIAHREADRGILDCAREVRPPFSPEAVTAEFAALLKTYGLRSVTGDKYAGEWPRERFREHGITYEPSEKTKSILYQEALPLFNSDRVELLDNARLISQFASLERRTARGGRDSVDHQ